MSIPSHKLRQFTGEIIKIHVNKTPFMTIDIESSDWNNGARVDVLEVHIERFLQQNSGKAYTAAEITGHLTAEEPQAFPEPLLGEEKPIESARLAVIVSRLEKLVWHNRVEARSANGELYYTNRSDGQFPVAEVEEEIPAQFATLERKLEMIYRKLDD